MEWRHTWTKEDMDGREAHRKSMINITTQLERYKADPLADANTPPHLVGKR